MQSPDVETKMRDSKNNLTFRIMAYRKLSQGEVSPTIASYLSQPKIRRRKTPLRNQEIVIITVFGCAPGL
jgi:hypothetical protein